MANNAPPSQNPADLESMEGLFNSILRKFLQQTDDMLPARVVAYDRDSNKATIQPVLAMVTTNGAQVARAQVGQVPVFRFGGGGMVLSFNLKPGDLGWLKANDRDISLFMQNLAPGAPNTARMHSFSDAMFFPDGMKNVVINGEDDAHAVLQTNDGKYRVAIWDDRVKVTGDNSSVEIKSGQVNVNALQINLNGSVSTGGGAGTPTVAIAATGNININAGGSVTIQGRNFMTHTHPTGGPNTGGVN